MMDKMFGFRLYREANGGGGGGGDSAGAGDTGQDDQGESKPKDAATIEFEGWLEKQPQDVQDRYSALPEEAQAFYRDQTAGLRKALTSERGLNKEAKARLKQLEEAETRRQRESLTELDRTKAERDDFKGQVTGLQTQIETLRVESAVLFEAAKLRFVAPEDAIALLDRKALKVGEDGKVEGVTEALKALAKAKPYLVAQPDKTGRIGTDTKIGANGKQEKKEQPPLSPSISL